MDCMWILQNLSSSILLSGIFPDILHICDLQIIPDAVASTLLEFVDGARNKDQALQSYRVDYEKWCNDCGFLVYVLVFLSCHQLPFQKYIHSYYEQFVFRVNTKVLHSLLLLILQTCSLKEFLMLPVLTKNYLQWRP